MDSSRIPEPSQCARALRAFIELARTGRIPCVMLRPRDIDGDGIFQGDFDFLIDDARFDEILAALFHLCQQTGVSFILRQSAPFKRQAELLHDDGRRVILEFWPHAELRTRGDVGPLSRAGVDYATYARLDDKDRGALLAALFLLHLHHKRKKLDTPLVRDRLAYFAERTVDIPGLGTAMRGLLAGTLELDAAHHTATAYLLEHDIAVIPPARIALKRLAWHLRRALHWPSWGTTAVVGPDGSGKSALIERIQSAPQGARFSFKRFKRLFRKPLFYWGSEPRNIRDEKRLWLILPVAWATFSLTSLCTGWRRPLVLDRYFYDYFVRNVRVGSQQPFRRIAAYALCSALAPRPQRLVIASCPPEIIHQRKQEMSREAIASMYDMYLDQVRRGRLAATLFCHTGVSLEESSRHALLFLGGPEPA
ncbi:Thymidylate kinase-like domain-containing protein [Bordetella sputigena]|uniref:hypothetical protein n=1 Tax=Bordetella sputigena TaxID=1416810 RepID=UPI0039F135E5